MVEEARSFTAKNIMSISPTQQDDKSVPFSRVFFFCKFTSKLKRVPNVN